MKPKNPHAVALGKLGGKKGGKARAAKLTPKQRSEAAAEAARASWAKLTPEQRSERARRAGRGNRKEK